MPWKSKAQQRWGNSPAGKKALGGQAAVDEWNAATDESSLPEKVANPKPRPLVKKPKSFHHTITGRPYGG